MSSKKQRASPSSSAAVKATAAKAQKRQQQQYRDEKEEEEEENEEEEHDGGGGSDKDDDEDSNDAKDDDGYPLSPLRPWSAPHFADQRPALTPTPLFTVNLNKSIGSEYSGLIEDVLRMVSLQFTIQVMLYFGNATERMFTEELFVLLFYIVLGVAFYWLFVRTLVTFR